MKILVTGGAGYIGSLLVPMLLDRGHEVTIFDRFTYGVRAILHFANRPEVSLIEGDVRDAGLIKRIVPGHDVVLHLAAIVGYPACLRDPVGAQSINVDGTRNVVDAMQSGQQLAYASTGSVYGKVEGICNEDSPTNPLTLYGKTKLIGEEMVLDWGGVALRFATVFGLSPRLRLDLMTNDFVYMALHDKQLVLFESHFRRTFLHCRDAAMVYPFVLDHYDEMQGKPYNVGDEDMNYTKREVAHLIRKHIDFYLHEADFGTDPDLRDYAVSYERIKKLGYRAEIGMEEGILELKKVLEHLRVPNEWRNA